MEKIGCLSDFSHAGPGVPKRGPTIGLFFGIFFGGFRALWVPLGSLLGHLAANEQPLIKAENLKILEPKPAPSVALPAEVAASDVAADVSSAPAAAGAQDAASALTTVSSLQLRSVSV